MQLKTTIMLEIEIYANFGRPVQARETKRLEKWRILQRSKFR